jgi:trk system potassium uptake protein TrkA
MKFCIIGLGVFGTHLARNLNQEGHEIIAVDNDPAHINALKDEIEYLIQADCTDLNAFHEIPVAQCDAVIIAIGEDFEASLSIVANVQHLGAKRIISRIINPLHGRLLKLLKINETMIPEAMAAAWLANTLKSPDILTSRTLGGGYEIAIVLVPGLLVGKTLRESGLRTLYDLNLVTVAKNRGTAAVNSTRQPIGKVLGNLEANRVFEADDVLVLFGLEKNIHRMLGDCKM